MKLPNLASTNTFTQTVDKFRGYDHRLRISDESFYDMENLTSDYFPLLSPSSPRKDYKTLTKGNGITSKDKLYWVDGTTLYIDGKPLDGLTLENSEKNLVSMGAYLVIFPDQVFVNTSKLTEGESAYTCTDKGSFGSAITEDISFRACTENGTGVIVYTSIEQGDTYNDGDYYVSGGTYKRYSSTNGWEDFTKTWYKLELTNSLTFDFERGNTVQLSGNLLNVSSVADFSGEAVVEAVANNKSWVVIVYNRRVVPLQTAYTFNDTTIDARPPLMDFVIEKDNRLYGCRYGENRNGDFVNEIYASALGSFRSWYQFQGISSDSYMASCGTDSPFTGVTVYDGNVLFFKEKCVHRLYGTMPSNFRVIATDLDGVESGSHKSVRNVNGTVIYKSRDGFVAYNGALPTMLSDNFGDEVYKNVVAGVYKKKYYASCECEDGSYVTFVYDKPKNMWHKETGLKTLDFVSHGGTLYALTESRIVAMSGGSDKVKWFAETGRIGLDMHNKKYVARIIFRMSAAVSSEIVIDAKFDEGNWERVTSIRTNSLRTFSVPVQTRRSDHIKFRFSGKGNCKIYSMTKVMEKGSAE